MDSKIPHKVASTRSKCLELSWIDTTFLSNFFKTSLYVFWGPPALPMPVDRILIITTPHNLAIHLHFLTGLVTDCPLTIYVPSICSPYTTDDGLWTSVLGAVKALRYQVPKDNSANYNTWNLCRGMVRCKSLFMVSGVPHNSYPVPYSKRLQ